MAYFERTGPRSFVPTEAVRGAWSADEQHIAPSLGLLTHLVETDHADRHERPLQVSRLSFDILGVVPMNDFEVDVRVRRPGRTIELVEATLTYGEGRVGVLLRAWLLAVTDSTAVAGSELDRMPRPEECEPWDPTEVWPGGFIASAQVRRQHLRPGRARFWVRTPTSLLDSEPVGPLACAAGLFDIANGMAVRTDPSRTVFPNVDLTAHLTRSPQPGWLGFDTSVTFGPDGRGLTSSALHDEAGPLGTVAQALTVRPRS